MTQDPPKGGLKRLQRESPEKTVEAYARRYREAVIEGDEFLGPLYLDELLTSILLAHSGGAKPSALEPDGLRSLARSHIGQLSPDHEHVVEEELNVAILKRYPKEF